MFHPAREIMKRMIIPPSDTVRNWRVCVRMSASASVCVCMSEQKRIKIFLFIKYLYIMELTFLHPDLQCE